MRTLISGSGLFILCLILNSWTNCPILQVRREPLYPIYLASNRVDTVDPWKNDFLGEQIVVYYRYSKPCPAEKNLVLTIRYKDRCYETHRFPLNKASGYWVYRLINEDYFAKGGILSYKVELCENEEIIMTWKHHLYVDLIEIQHVEEDPIVSLTDLVPNK